MDPGPTPAFTPSAFLGLDKLPDELLVEVARHLEVHDSTKRANLRNLSLVSKKVLHSCNEACGSLSLSGLKASRLPRLLRRFSDLTSLNLSFLFDCSDDALVAVGKHCKRLLELHVPDTCKAPVPSAGQGLLSVCRGCPRLRVLSLPSYKGPESALLALGHARELRMLRLKGAQNLNDAVIQGIARSCQGIEELDLSFNSITDVSLEALGSNLPRLKKLDLRHCKKVTGAGVAALAVGCRKLQSLHLGCLELNDACLVALGRYSKELTELCLDYGAGADGTFSHDALTAIAQGCLRLRVLSLRGSKQVDDQSLRGLARGCPSLQELDLHACTDVADAALKSIVTGCKQLRVLVLTGTSVGPAGEAAFHGGLPHLQTLRLNGELISDLVLKSVGQHCPALEELHLNNSPVTDYGLEFVLGGCGHIQTLALKACTDVKGNSFVGKALPQLHTVQLPSSGLSDQGLLGLMTAAPELSSLTISSCTKLTPKGCLDALSLGSALSSLVITGCPQLSRDGIVQLIRVAKPALKLVRVSRPGSLDDEYSLKRASGGWSLPCWARGSCVSSAK